MCPHAHIHTHTKRHTFRRNMSLIWEIFKINSTLYSGKQKKMSVNICIHIDLRFSNKHEVSYNNFSNPEKTEEIYHWLKREMKRAQTVL